MKHLKNRAGTTLVELVVCMALLGIFSVAAVALVQPCAAAFTEMQRLTRAQNLADIVVENLRGELQEAKSFVYFVDEGTSTNWDAPFTGENKDEDKNKYQTGSGGLLFRRSTGQIELIDAGYMPETSVTKKTDSGTGSGTTTATEYKAKQPGTVHYRFFSDSSKSIPIYEDGTTPIAYAYTEAMAENSYMNMRVKLKFYARSYTSYNTNAHFTLDAVTVVVQVYGTTTDSGGTTINEADLICTRKAIIALPGTPELLRGALGQWTGWNSSSSTSTASTSP